MKLKIRVETIDDSAPPMPCFVDTYGGGGPERSSGEVYYQEIEVEDKVQANLRLNKIIIAFNGIPTL